MAKSNEPESSQWRRFAKLRSSSRELPKRARKIEKTTLRHAHRFVVKRWNKAQDLRRHIIGWLALVSLLIVAALLQGGMWYPSAYSTQAPTVGSVYAEGVVGELNTINPLFATTPAELSASKLVFSSLLDYDTSGDLRGDLAADWHAVDDGKAYVVKLRKDIYWHDGHRVTAADIVFTVSLMKNPRVDSKFYDSWKNVKVKKLSKRKVKFILPGAYAPFPSALTFGILPKHLLKDVNPSRLRESKFSQHPVGSGPFQFSFRQVISVNDNRLVLQLKANPYYYRGEPRLDRFQLHVYSTVEALKQAFLSGQVNAITSPKLSTDALAKLHKLRPDSELSHIALNNGVFALFNLNDAVLEEQKVRRALLRASNRVAIIEALHGNARLLTAPLLDNQYREKGNLAQAPFNRQKAVKLLKQAGWKKDGDGVRSKGKHDLTINIVAPNSGDYPVVAKQLAKDWRAVGVGVAVKLVDPEDIIQNVIRPRAYDVLIYNIKLGSDPDQFAYWHSSQANPDGLNLSNYKSDIVDEALATARAKLKPSVRSAKYNVFVKQWLEDVPAIALYQPTLHYLSTDDTYSLEQGDTLINRFGRYRNVIYWSVGQREVFTTP